MIKIWTNTKTLEGYHEGLIFTSKKNEADIILSGSKKVVLEGFSNLKAIFRAGIGKDNIPEKEALNKNIVVRFPSSKTIDIIFEETSNFTCNLIFKMMYRNIGDLNKWIKNDRSHLGNLNLLVIGMGNIGSRVYKKMSNFMNVFSFDILTNTDDELNELIAKSDCITIHIPNNPGNKSFFNLDKFNLMKKDSVLINTARGDIVNEDQLYNFIKRGKIRAAFDVFWEEPYTGKLLKFHPNRFFMSPHIASTCIEFLEGCSIGLNQLVKELS